MMHCSYTEIVLPRRDGVVGAETGSGPNMHRKPRERTPGLTLYRAMLCVQRRIGFV